jgi:hypothetical protein
MVLNLESPSTTGTILLKVWGGSMIKKIEAKYLETTLGNEGFLSQIKGRKQLTRGL